MLLFLAFRTTATAPDDGNDCVNEGAMREGGLVIVRVLVSTPISGFPAYSRLTILFLSL